MVMTKAEIKELRPELKNYNVVDYFIMSEGYLYYGIRSGLRHTDGEIVSPYFYEHTEFGEDAEEKAIKHFTKWWDSLII